MKPSNGLYITTLMWRLMPNLPSPMSRLPPFLLYSFLSLPFHLHSWFSFLSFHNYFKKQQFLLNFFYSYFLWRHHPLTHSKWLLCSPSHSHPHYPSHTHHTHHTHTSHIRHTYHSHTSHIYISHTFFTYITHTHHTYHTYHT